jgi:uncharacterized protein YjbJ (UPF0337 family)
MDWNRVEGNWKQVKGKVKERWGKLTDNDLDVIAGKQDQLGGKIQQRYGYQSSQKGNQGLVRPSNLVKTLKTKSPEQLGAFCLYSMLTLSRFVPSAKE